MGIDIYLKWKDMDKEAQAQQLTGFNTVAGHVGYLRESYHGGPYATKILCREAFESKTCEAKIPAAVLRERLTQITEPAYGVDGGHEVAVMLSSLLGALGKEVSGVCSTDGRTVPMSVEDAVRKRYATLYPEDAAQHVEDVVQSFRNFVALAERKEKQTGHPCTIHASY